MAQPAKPTGTDIAPAARFGPGRAELPSMRRHLRDPATQPVPAATSEWLQDKRARDGELTGCPADLWLVHGTLYDLKAFVKSHPGGAQWLESTQGTDCTVHFEVHHLDIARARAALARFRLADDDPRQVAFAAGGTGRAFAAAAYDWGPPGGDSSLYARMRAASLSAVRAGGGPHANGLCKGLCALAVLLFAASFAATCCTGSTLAAAVAGYLVYVLFGIGHNFFHQRDSLWRFAADVSAFGSEDWRVSHCQSHHLYPNLEIDREASALEPYCAFLRSHPTNPWAVYIYWGLLMPSLPLFDMITTWSRIALRTVRLRTENLLIPLEFATLAATQGPWRGALLFYVMHGVMFVLVQFFSTPVHRSEYSWTEGCVAPAADATAAGAAAQGGSKKNGNGESVTMAPCTGHEGYAEHIFATTADYWVEFSHRWPRLGLLFTIFVGGSFNNHVAHHLFPTLDMSQHHLVYPVVLEHGRACGYGLVDGSGAPEVGEHTFFELLASTLRVWHRPAGNIMFKPRPGVAGDAGGAAAAKKQA